MLKRIPVSRLPGDYTKQPVGYLELDDEYVEELTKNLVDGHEYHLGFWISNPRDTPKLRLVWLCPDPCEAIGV